MHDSPMYEHLTKLENLWQLYLSGRYIRRHHDKVLEDVSRFQKQDRYKDRNIFVEQQPKSPRRQFCRSTTAGQQKETASASSTTGSQK